MTLDFLKRSAAVLLMGSALSACAALGTEVAGDDPDTEIPNVSMGRSIMQSLGAVPERRLPINYSPRAPLVVPASTNALVQPESPNQLTASPNWPDDPDLATARRLREAAAREAGREASDITPPSEALALRVPPSRKIIKEEDLSKVVGPAGLKAPAGFGQESTLYDAAGQPRRRALVEPPVEYLKPAEGVPVEVYEDPNAQKKKGFLNWLSW